MTDAALAAMNRDILIVSIADRAPWLTEQDIAKWLGLSRQYVRHVLDENFRLRHKLA